MSSCSCDLQTATSLLLSAHFRQVRSGDSRQRTSSLVWFARLDPLHQLAADPRGQITQMGKAGHLQPGHSGGARCFNPVCPWHRRTTESGAIRRQEHRQHTVYGPHRTVKAELSDHDRRPGFFGGNHSLCHEYRQHHG